jgi:transcriptional regulator with XRE-family HTH domain
LTKCAEMCGDVRIRGAESMHSEQTYEGSESVALLVREELARRRLSRQWLADEAKVSLSTIEKALGGSRSFTLATVVRLEDALGTSLRGIRQAAEPAPKWFAPESMGAYARPAVEWLEGTYLTLRPSFSEPDAIFAYLTSILWDEAGGHLAFSEASRTDSEYEQKGFVSFPNVSGAIYLVTISEGQYRLALLNRPTAAGLSGILLTLAAGQGAQLIPAAVPITLLATSRCADAEVGVIRAGHRCFAEYRDCVDRVTHHGYARFPL